MCPAAASPAIAGRERPILHHSAHAEHALDQAKRPLLLELVFEDVGDVAAAQQIEPVEQHVLLGEPVQALDLRRGDAECLGKSLDLDDGFARRHAVGQCHHQHAVDELLAQLGRGKASRQLGRRDSRQGVEIRIDPQDHLLGRLEQGTLHWAHWLFGCRQLLHGAQAQEGGGGIGSLQTHGVPFSAVQCSDDGRNSSVPNRSI